MESSHPDKAQGPSQIAVGDDFLDRAFGITNGYVAPLTLRAADIAVPRDASEREFWDAAYLAALHRCNAIEASLQASFALVERREMDQARNQSRSPIDSTCHLGSADPAPDAV